jgi:hypothetical protein
MSRNKENSQQQKIIKKTEPVKNFVNDDDDIRASDTEAEEYVVQAKSLKLANARNEHHFKKIQEDNREKGAEIIFQKDVIEALKNKVKTQEETLKQIKEQDELRKMKTRSLKDTDRNTIIREFKLDLEENERAIKEKYEERRKNLDTYISNLLK